jgi:hypothetical protein
MGKKRHDVGREGDKGYPVCCVRTRNYLYVRNYAPARWPAGNPETGYTNLDSSPTKTLIHELNHQGDSRYYNWSFVMRSAEELFDVRKDTACMNNLAWDSEHAGPKAVLRESLEQAL